MIRVLRRAGSAVLFTGMEGSRQQGGGVTRTGARAQHSRDAGFVLESAGRLGSGSKEGNRLLFLKRLVLEEACPCGRPCRSIWPAMTAGRPGGGDDTVAALALSCLLLLAGDYGAYASTHIRSLVLSVLHLLFHCA